jgi:hypothetical protein
MPCLPVSGDLLSKGHLVLLFLCKANKLALYLSPAWQLFCIRCRSGSCPCGVVFGYFFVVRMCRTLMGCGA